MLVLALLMPGLKERPKRKKKDFLIWFISTLDCFLKNERIGCAVLFVAIDFLAAPSRNQGRAPYVSCFHILM